MYAYEYDALGRRKHVTNSGAAFEATAHSEYGYNDRSEVTAADRFLGTPSDKKEEITKEKCGYEYDAIGNRVTAFQMNIMKEKDYPTDKAYTVSKVNQYDTVRYPPMAERYADTFDYDDDGNLIHEAGVNLSSNSEPVFWYAYDAENRLIRTKRTASNNLEFLYDYMGRRVRADISYSSSSGKEKIFVYDGWNVISEITVSTKNRTPVPEYYVWGPDLSGTL